MSNETPRTTFGIVNSDTITRLYDNGKQRGRCEGLAAAIEALLELRDELWADEGVRAALDTLQERIHRLQGTP